MRTHTSHLRTSITLLIFAATFSLSIGCSQFEVNKSLPWKKAEEPPKAARILAIWSDTVLNKTGKPAMRGFGGRVFFYGEKEGDPIEVDGAVLVYAFDAEQLNKNSVAPEKKFVFPAKNLASHYSKCSLGHSYSFWLPWDKVGGKTRQISLIVRYEGSDGTVVLSDASRKLLPGVSSALTADRSEDSAGTSRARNTRVTKSTESVRQIGFNAPATTSSNETGGFDSTTADTISLTPSMSQRLMRSDGASARQHMAANKQHLQALSSINDGVRRSPVSTKGVAAPTVTQPAGPVAPGTIPLLDGRTVTPQNSAQNTVASPMAATAVPSHQLPAVGYQPTLSQAPFASTAQRIGAGRLSRQTLGSPQFGRPPVQRPGTPQVR